MNEQNNKVESGGGECGPGCNCGTGGAGKRVKWVVCGVVALAAVVVVAAKSTGTKATDQGKSDYGSLVPAAVTVDVAKAAAPVDAGVWGAPLKSVAELNEVATNTEAVFLVVPANDSARVAAIQKEVAAATATISARGIRMGDIPVEQGRQGVCGDGSAGRRACRPGNVQGTGHGSRERQGSDAGCAVESVCRGFAAVQLRAVGVRTVVFRMQVVRFGLG